MNHHPTIKLIDERLVTTGRMRNIAAFPTCYIAVRRLLSGRFRPARHPFVDLWRMCSVDLSFQHETMTPSSDPDPIFVPLLSPGQSSLPSPEAMSVCLGVEVDGCTATLIQAGGVASQSHGIEKIGL